MSKGCNVKSSFSVEDGFLFFKYLFIRFDRGNTFFLEEINDGTQDDEVKFIHRESIDYPRFLRN